MRRTSCDQVLRVAQMTAHDVDEGRVALGGPNGSKMADQPNCPANYPEAKTQPDGRGKRAVDDRDGARRTAEEDRFGQGAMDWRVETDDGLSLFHQTSTPPPNWKNDRKKLDAAKAIDRPKTI
jgi:hypothetical protein